MNAPRYLAAFPAFLSLFLFACGLVCAQAPAGKVYVVRTGRPSRQSISQAIRKTGEIVSPSEVVLSSKISGRLLSLDADGVRLEEGVKVTKGQRLAVIESGDYAAQLAASAANVASAEATLKDKKREFARNETLFKEGTATERDRDISEADYERAVASLAQAKAQETLSRINLDETVIYSPMDGVISARHAEPGTLLAAGAKILTITQVDPLRFQVDLPTTIFGKIEKGGYIGIEVDAYPGTVVTGAISRIFPVADGITRTVKVESDLGNGDGRFVPGMYAVGNIGLDRRENALVVPFSAIVRNGDKRLVYRVKNDIAEAVEVKTGVREDAVIEILDGLADDDEIVIEGHHRLASGVRVKNEGR